MTKTKEMESIKSFQTEKDFQGFSLIVAPLWFAISTFFWVNGEYSVRSAILIVFSMFFWIPALTGLFGLLKRRMPHYAVWGLRIAVYGCILGCCFAFLGFLAAIFNIPHQNYLQILWQHPIISQILLFAAGPLLNLLLLGINFIRTKTVHLWIGLLFCLGAIAFPLSRIPGIQLVAHIADVLLLIPSVYIGVHFLIKPNASFASQ